MKKIILSTFQIHKKWKMCNLYCHQCCLSQTSTLDRNLLLQANFDQQRFGAVCILEIPILSRLPESIDWFNKNKTGPSYILFRNIGIRESLDLLAYCFICNGGGCSIGECWIIRVSANARACGYLSFTRATSVRQCEDPCSRWGRFLKLMPVTNTEFSVCIFYLSSVFVII